MFSHFTQKIMRSLQKTLFTPQLSISEAAQELDKAHWHEERFKQCISQHNDSLVCDKNDIRNAMWFYLRAALRGDKDAQYQLGISYLNGHLGLDRSYKNAEKWLDQAAHQGHRDAKHVLEKTLNYFNIS